MFDETRKKIILAADDFGKSEKANRNILALAKVGKLDRVSVMVDGNFASGEIEELAKTDVALDIHFELSWQKKRREKLEDNTIRQGFVFLKNHFQSSQRKKIKNDWKAQIEKFYDLIGQYPDGINSHEYVHLFPSYFKIALGFAAEFDISFVRFAKLGLLGKNNLAKLVLKNLCRWDKEYFFASGLDSSDFFVSLDWLRDVGVFLKNIPDGKTEMACHPEREDEFELIDKYF
jgi:chitin disaccharide deacetylase